ncbi:conjugal transfer protein TraN [Vibrio halioticoli NBRC 102217]|uniref:Conjugal transfer protein TraN n=1 Tax=Vibrio halioticoli NBRC 102217 TaxID=1219072 RepID=V5FJL0_9VIBR|nr:conjugal transfer protein TraN [Vibrio halioticoli]GAD89941.1 conjugal transfer protein TraN [Vibrio halioticoli NBRC 102217]
MPVEYSCPPSYPNFFENETVCKSNEYSPIDGYEAPATPSCLTGYTFDSASSMCVADSVEPTLDCPTGGVLNNDQCQIAEHTECRQDIYNHSSYTTTNGDYYCSRAKDLRFYRWDNQFVYAFSEPSPTGDMPSVKVGNFTYSENGNAQNVLTEDCQWFGSPGLYSAWESSICRTSDPETYFATKSCPVGYSLNSSQTQCIKDDSSVSPTWTCPSFLPVFDATTNMCSISTTAKSESKEQLNYDVTKNILESVLAPFEMMLSLTTSKAVAEDIGTLTEEEQVTQSSMQSYVGEQFVAAAIEAEQQKDMVAVGQQQIMSLTSTSTNSVAGTTQSVVSGNVSCELFKGTASECKIAVGGVQDCCKNPTTISLGDYIGLISKTLQFDALTGQVFELEGYTGAWDIASNWTTEAAGSAWSTVKTEFASAFDITLTESTSAAGAGGSAGVGQALMSYTNDFLAERFGEELAGMFFQTTAEGAVAWSAEMAAVGNALMVVYYAYLAYVVFNLLVNIIYECEEAELDLAMKKDLYSTHYIGSYCKDEVLGACIEKRQVYCSYDSPLSRIMMEQVYAQPHMGLDWGTPKNPNCTGLAIEQLEDVDWDNINLDEWMGILIKTGNYTDMINIDADSLTGSGSNLNYEKDLSRQNVIERNVERASNIDADQIRRDAYEDAWNTSYTIDE